jgi:hypothetical protein
VDFLLAQSGDRRSIHITFFGGETLMNFPLLKEVVAYGNQRAAEQGRHIDFSLTTNATLLTPTIIEFLSENNIGVTVSMDGPKEMHDHLRVFSNGKGSYDIIEPKVRALIQNHRTRPITARVTLTAGVSDVIRIFRHLKQDLGFHEVGFAPVTTSPNQLYAINATGMDSVLDQFHTLADEYLEHALRGESHGFSNVSDTLAELCQGVNKSHPCGAGLGLLGVGPVRRHRAVPPFCGLRCPRAGAHFHRHRQSQADRFSDPRPHRFQIRLPHLLGAPAVRRRLPSRSICTLRGHGPSQSPLLRLDPGLDRHVPRNLWRDRGQESGFLQQFAERKAS